MLYEVITEITRARMEIQIRIFLARQAFFHLAELVDQHDHIGQLLDTINLVLGFPDGQTCIDREHCCGYENEKKRLRSKGQSRHNINTGKQIQRITSLSTSESRFS